MADPGQNAADNRDAAEAVAEVTQFQYLDAPIRRRKAFSNAGGQGLSVLELAPKDAKACDELQVLAALVFNMQSISIEPAKNVQTLSEATRRI